MSLLPRRSPRLAQGRSKLDHSISNKENVENSIPSRSTRKRKGEITLAPSKRQTTVDNENEAGRREGMACATVRTLTVRDVDEEAAMALEVDDLLALKFTSNKHDYKNRLEERMKFTAMLKERIKAQASQASLLVQQGEDKVTAAEAELAAMEQKLIELQQNKSEVEEEKQTAEEACNAQQAVLDKLKETSSEVYEDMLNLETELAALTEETEQVTVRIQQARDAVVAAKDNTVNLGERNDKLQEYNKSLQEYNTKMQSDLKELQENHNKAIEDQVIAKRTLESLKCQGTVKETELETIKIQLETDEGTVTELKARNETVSTNLETQSALLEEAATVADGILKEVNEYRRTHGKTQGEFDALAAKKQSINDQMESDNQRLAQMRNEVNEMKTKLKTADIEAQAKLKQFSVLQDAFETSDAKVRELNQLKSESDKLQLKMRNKILDLKGTVRVFCRVKSCNEESALTMVPEPGSEGRLELAYENKQLVFGFDRHFNPSVEQLAMFDEVAPNVEQVMNGAHSCIMAFGSSKTGKTNTMIGSAFEEGSAHRGVMPRAVQLLLGQMSSMQADGWNHTMKVTLAETVADKMWDAANSTQLMDGTHLEQIQASYGRIVTDFSQVAEMFEEATAAESPTSHLIMMVSVEGEHTGKGLKANGTLTMCDLAFEHTSNLKEVFSAIASAKTPHFGNSRLTQMMQPSLTKGQGKASMIVHVDPSAAAAGDTLAALRFATQARSCLLR